MILCYPAGARSRYEQGWRLEKASCFLACLLAVKRARGQWHGAKRGRKAGLAGLGISPQEGQLREAVLGILGETGVEDLMYRKKASL